MRPISFKGILVFLKNLPLVWWEDLKETRQDLIKMFFDIIKISTLFAYTFVFLLISIIMGKKTLIIIFSIAVVILYFWKKYDSGKDIEIEKRRKYEENKKHNQLQRTTKEQQP